MFQISRELATIIMVLGVLPSGAIIYFLWEDREKPGVIWLIISFGVFIVWGLSFTIIVNTSHQVVKLLSTYLFVITPFTTASAWFMFSYEFISKKSVPRWAYSFFILSIIAFILAIINPFNFMFQTDPSNTYLIFPSSPNTLRFLLNVIIAYSLVFFGTGMVIGEGIRTPYMKRKKQAGIIFLTTIILVVTSLAKVTDMVPPYFDPTPLAVSFGFLLFTYSVHRHGLGRQVAIARQKTVELSTDVMIVTDSEGSIVDTNKKARSIFGNPLYGTDITQLFGKDADNVEIEQKTGTREFIVKSTSIDYGRGEGAVLYILSEVTEIKKREKELDLLRQIMQRVFRHNVRNKLTTIIGNIQILKEKGDEEMVENLDIILDNAQKLGETSEKAMAIGEVINLSETISTDLKEEVQIAINDTFKKHSDKDIELDKSIHSFTANVHPKFHKAIAEILENGIEHNDANISFKISTRETQEEYQLWICDNGESIPEIELNSLRNNSESSIEHSDGAGLWLIKWILERSNTQYRFYTNDGIDGTVTKISILKGME